MPTQPPLGPMTPIYHRPNTDPFGNRASPPFTHAYMVEYVFRIKATRELYNVSPGNSTFSNFYIPVFSVCNQPLSHTLPTTFPTLSPQTPETTLQTPPQPSHMAVFASRGRPSNPPKNGGSKPHSKLISHFQHNQSLTTPPPHPQMSTPGPVALTILFCFLVSLLLLPNSLPKPLAAPKHIYASLLQSYIADCMASGPPATTPGSARRETTRSNPSTYHQTLSRIPTAPPPCASNHAIGGITLQKSRFAKRIIYCRRHSPCNRPIGESRAIHCQEV